nr:unnamed protein product [Callosobruchus chinensis]
MDLDFQTVEIKQEVEKCEEIEDTNCMKTIKDEPDAENWNEFDGMIDPLGHVKTEHHATVQIKSEESEACINMSDEEVDTPDLIQIKKKSAAQKENWVKALHVVNSETERNLYFCSNCSYSTYYQNTLISHIAAGHCSSKTQISNSGLVPRRRRQRTRKTGEFVCSHCDKSFKNKFCLDGHIVKVHTELSASVSSKIHECTSCNFKTVYTTNFKKHMWKHTGLPSSSKFYSCVQCNKIVNTKTLLDEHILRRHPKLAATVSSKIHHCTVCGYKSTNKSNFDQHRAVHSNAVYKVSICEYCEAKFSCKPSLLGHILKQHPEAIEAGYYKVHECEICNYKSAYNRDLKRHVLRVHAEAVSKSVSCKHCDATFKTDRLLDSHVLLTHSETVSTKYECANCTFKCFIKADLERHMTRDHMRAVKMYNCSECRFKTRIKDYLEKHVLLHPARNQYICHNCNYATDCKNTLIDHVASCICISKTGLVKSGSEPSQLKKFVCTKCQKQFKKKLSLHNHIVQIHPEMIAMVSYKILECTICHYKTVNTTHFQRHMSKHTGIPCSDSKRKRNRPSEVSVCAYCQKSYKSRVSLDGHVLRMHSEFEPTVSSKIHQCTSCSYKTVIRSHFNRHMWTHADLCSSKLKLCIQCKTVFKTKELLDEHILNKHPKTVTSESSVCRYCEAKFDSTQSLLGHVSKKHPEAVETDSYKVHLCTNCDYKTAYKHNLESHMMSCMHHSQTYISCKQCKARFKTERYLNDHVSRKHPDTMPKASVNYQCANCTVAKKKNRRSDLQVGHGKADRQSFICYNCNYADHSKRGLTKHMAAGNCRINSGSPKKYNCKQCHKSFKRKVALDNHVSRCFKPNKTKYRGSNECAHCKAVYKSKKLLDGHILREHPNFSTSVSSKILRCTSCDYKTTHKIYLTKHKRCMHSDTALLTCTHCNAKFKTKSSLFNHIVQSHPSFASTVTSKVHECSKCSYKTTRRYHLDRHLLNHADCDMSFKSKMMLENHITLRHSNLVTAFEGIVYECSDCAYKTGIKSDFDEHTLTHSSSDRYPCAHCDLSFKHKAALFNHIIKRHPETMASIPGKILECSSCSYKTTRKANLKKHELLHADSDLSLLSCMRCDAFFRTMRPFGEHVIKQHPNFVSSIPCKVHECIHCEFKTTYANHFADHMTQHTGISSKKMYPCKHCDVVFTSKQSMDDHVLRKHPDFVATVTSKLHTCKYCPYKTTLQTNLSKHLADHTEIFGKRYPCAHCVSSFKSKQSLDNHILKKHFEFNASVSCKVYKCDKCSYVTAFRHCLTNHNCRNIKSRNFARQMSNVTSKESMKFAFCDIQI